MRYESSFCRPFGAGSSICMLPTACVVGCTLSPLRGCGILLPVAGAAAGDVTDANLPVSGRQFSDANLIFRDQVCAKRILIAETVAVHGYWVVTSWLLVAHIKDLIARTQ